MNKKKYRPQSKRSQRSANLILCEGRTEQLYFEKLLDTAKCKVIKSKHSNVEKLVNDAKTRLDGLKEDLDNIFCVFDHDSSSNTEKQLQSVNKIIKESHGKLHRVFSSPCIERAFLFHFSNSDKEYTDCQNAEDQIYLEFKNNGSTNINKKDADIEKYVNQIIIETDFQKICDTTKRIYDRLKIDDNNWLDIGNYSEIFKLEHLKLTN